MATMLAGASVIDASLLLIAANEDCPQPQTAEHLAAVEMMRLEHVIILQNKVDTVVKLQNKAHEQHQDIIKFVRGTKAEGAPIIPISAELKYNIDCVCDYISRIPIPTRDFTCSPQMTIVRSFDVNKPGTEIENLRGGVVGGSLLEGVIRVGEKVEIRPGIIGKDSTGKFIHRPIVSRITSLQAEQNQLLYAVPGGLIAVGLQIDPAHAKGDNLNGQILGHPDHLPMVVNEVDISYHLLIKLLGVRSEGEEKKSKKKVSGVKEGEILLINIAACSVPGKVLKSSKSEKARIKFDKPVCCTVGDKLTLSRKIKNFRLIGWGEVRKGYLM